MPVDPEVVKKKLARLQDYISRMENMEFDRAELLEDVDIQDMLTHRLHTAVEEMIDLCMHVASGLNLPNKENAKDVILLLGREKILSADLVDRIAQAPATRNLIVHEYHQVDFAVLEKYHQDHLQDLKDFAKEIVTYLQQEQIL